MKSFLLGAGASVDAGLPGTVDLTKRVAEYVDENHRWRGISQVLHVVIGAMVQHDTGRGSGAFDGIDVERVFAAVKALKDRSSIDLSAFVESWNHNLDALARNPQFPGFWERNLRSGILGGFHEEHRLRQSFEEGVRAVLGGDASDLFRQLEGTMLDALIAILQVDPSNVAYLNPFVGATELNAVATLNYDLSVELACEGVSVSVDTGLNAWSGGYDWRWDDGADLKLLKLHGSLDYVLGENQVEGMRVRGDHLSYFGPTRSGQLVGGVPAMVFGQGSKLRSDGPFLAMLVEFDRILADTDWLTVVGYSFRDDHINAALARWMNGPRARRLSVIDPAIERWTAQYSQDCPTFFRQLQAGVRGQAQQGSPRVAFPSLEHDFIAKPAAEGLAAVHGGD